MFVFPWVYLEAPSTGINLITTYKHRTSELYFSIYIPAFVCIVAEHFRPLVYKNWAFYHQAWIIQEVFHLPESKSRPKGWWRGEGCLHVRYRKNGGTKTAISTKIIHLPVLANKRILCCIYWSENLHIFCV